MPTPSKGASGHSSNILAKAPGTSIQWYPGHIAKVERELAQHLKLVDVAIEVLDARLPETTQNPRIKRKLLNSGPNGKPTLIVLNKSDLADPVETRHWKQYLAKHHPGADVENTTTNDVTVLAYDSVKGGGKAQIIAAVLALAETKLKSLVAKGLMRRPVRVLVVGMPNVGKSTIINSLVGQKKAKTGHKAGVTRQPQWVRIHPQIELLDTPGIIPPTLDSELSGLLLACVSGIGEAAFDEEEAARFLLTRIESLYPALLSRQYKLVETTDLSDAFAFLSSISERLGHRQNAEHLDTLRTAQAVLKDFRHGKLGRLTLEKIHI